MGFSDWLILAGVACLAFAALRSIRTRRGNCCAGCSGNCKECRGNVRKP